MHRHSTPIAMSYVFSQPLNYNTCEGHYNPIWDIGKLLRCYLVTIQNFSIDRCQSIRGFQNRRHRKQSLFEFEKDQQQAQERWLHFSQPFLFSFESEVER